MIEIINDSREQLLPSKSTNEWITFKNITIRIEMINQLLRAETEQNNMKYCGISEHELKKIVKQLSITKALAMRLWSSFVAANQEVAIYALKDYKISLIELELLIIAEKRIRNLELIYQTLISNQEIEPDIFTVTLESKNNNLTYMKYKIAERKYQEGSLDYNIYEKLFVECNNEKEFYPRYVQKVMKF